MNAKKTSMLCMSNASSFGAATHIYNAEGAKTESGDGLKVLGFHFSRKSGVHAHVDSLRKRFRRKYWCLYHLRKNGFNEEELAKEYRTILLPIADY